MLGAAVVHHEIENHANVALVRLVEKMVKVRARSVVLLDRFVIGRVVAVIARRLEDRHQPDAVDAQVVAEVIEFRSDAVEVADAVAIGVDKAAYEDLVEDCAARPLASWRWTHRALAIGRGGGGAGKKREKRGREGD